MFTTAVSGLFPSPLEKKSHSCRFGLNRIIFYFILTGWSGGAMVLGKLPVPGRPTIWMIVGQRPTALAVGAGGVVWTFLLLSILSLLCLSLGDGPI